MPGKRDKVLAERPCFALMLLLVAFGVLNSQVRASQVESYHYLERVGSETTLFEWRLSRSDRITITAREQAGLFVNVCSREGDTRWWRMHMPGTRASAWQVEDVLHLQGVREGEVVRREISLNGTPWYQPLSYSLRRFLARAEKRKEFWTIRPDTLEAVKLVATNLGLEKIRLDGREVSAWKVRISLAGLLSFAWSAHYWFRQSDLLFVQYRGRNGMPGTPVTVIRLQEDR